MHGFDRICNDLRPPTQTFALSICEKGECMCLVYFLGLVHIPLTHTHVHALTHARMHAHINTSFRVETELMGLWSRRKFCMCDV